MSNSDRAERGRKAIEAAIPGYEYDDVRTNAVDAIANILHAVAEGEGVAAVDAEFVAGVVVESALRHFTAERAGED